VVDVDLHYGEAQVEVGIVSGLMAQRVAQAAIVPDILSQDPAVMAALRGFGPEVLPSALPLAARQAQWSTQTDLLVLSGRFERILAGFKLKTLWVSNAAGDTVAAAHAPDMRPFLGTNFAQREYFKAARLGKPGHQFAIGRLSNMHGLYFSSPVMDNGVFVGMVGAAIDAAEFAPQLDDISGLVADDNGVVVMAKDPTWLMRTLPQSTVHGLTPEQRTERYKRQDFEPLGLQQAPNAGPQRLFTWRDQPHPLIVATRSIAGGMLQVLTFRSQASVLTHNHADRLWSFGAMALSASLLLSLVAGALLYIETTRHQRRAMHRLNERLRRQANVDGLTGVASRRHYLGLLVLEMGRAQRHNLPFCLLSLDIDHFKRVNDTHGHGAGDAVLAHFAHVVQAELRQNDVVGRIGGEEFSVLLPQTDTEGGQRMAQRLRAVVEAASVTVDQDVLRVTVSIGGVQWQPEQALSMSELMAAADHALYAAKQGGRNQVAWFQSENALRDERASV
jgi:diguanylate cyclase (GGDEF)-like protein